MKSSCLGPRDVEYLRQLLAEAPPLTAEQAALVVRVLDIRGRRDQAVAPRKRSAAA